MDVDVSNSRVQVPPPLPPFPRVYVRDVSMLAQLSGLPFSMLGFGRE